MTMEINTDTVAQQDEQVKSSIREKLHIQYSHAASRTLLFAVAGVFLYIVVSMIPMPFRMVGILKFGLLPAVTIIALVGATRGSLAGFITGYLGEVLYGLLVYNVVVTMTLTAVAYGILGLVVGFGTYDFTNGRSLAKLSILAVIGFLITILLTVVIGIGVEKYSLLTAIAYLMLPLVTLGLPTLFFLTPVLAKLCFAVSEKVVSLSSYDPTE